MLVSLSLLLFAFPSAWAQQQAYRVYGSRTDRMLQRTETRDDAFRDRASSAHHQQQPVNRSSVQSAEGSTHEFGVATVGFAQRSYRNQEPYRNRPYQSRTNRNCLTGTYQLNPARSDDVQIAAEQATRGHSLGEQERILNVLVRRLEPPDRLAFDRNGRTVTVASTRSPEVMIDADGRYRTERTPRGSTVSVYAAFSGDRLMISRTGERGRDYTVTFDPMEGCEQLRVTRRLSVAGLSQQISVQSTYDRTSNTAEMALYSGRRDDSGRRRADDDLSVPRTSSFVVPDGTRIRAVLNEDLATGSSRQGERFSLLVRSPAAYEGAIIEGYVVDLDRSGGLSGRSEIALDFERIRLRDGSVHRFFGYLESARTALGNSVRVDSEGVLQQRSTQGSRLATRAGIGAGIGALIGAIVDGAEGAAIGAAIGAGGGAGSVFIDGGRDLELRSGSEFVIRSATSRRSDL
jgi:hypothetical protein